MSPRHPADTMRPLTPLGMQRDALRSAGGRYQDGGWRRCPRRDRSARAGRRHAIRSAAGRYQGGGNGRDALAATGQPEPVGSRPGQADRNSSEGSGDRSLRIGTTGGDPWPVADHLNRDVADREPGIGEQSRGLAKQLRPPRALPPRLGGTELTAEISEASRGQQRIARSMRNRITIGMTGQAPLARPVQTCEVQLAPVTEWVDVYAHANPREQLSHPASAPGSGSQDLVEQRLGLVLVGLLGKRQLAHQDLPRLGEHPLLSRGKPALAIATPQITNHLGDLVHITRSKLLQVGLVPARPVGGLLGIRGTQNLEDSLQALLPDHVPDSDELGII